MRNKNFKYAKGVYYFVVRNGQQNITIKRVKKNEAVMAFSAYKQNGKDVTWLGCWDGKKWQESSAPTSAEA